MPLSRYCKVYPLPGKPGYALLFSTRKGALSVLPSAALERVASGVVPAEAAATLEKVGVLAPDLEEEQARVLGYLDEVNRLNSSVILAVILGMACNFACPYCYEGTLKGADAMDEATAEAVVAFALGRLGAGKKKLVVDFYGGEPLLYLDRLRQIVGPLQARAAERGASFEFTLVTNGWFLTPEVVEVLLPLGLAGAKVTLDGPPEVHDRTRPLRSGGGSFETVLANVRACCGLLPVVVGGNYTAETWRSFPRLLDRLEAEGLGPERLAHVRFEPVVQVRDRYGSPEFTAGCCSQDEPWVIEASLALREEVLRRGHRTSRLQPTPCMAEIDDAFTVHWDGSLYKCLGLIGRLEFAAGDVRSGPADHRAAYGGERWKASPECRDCSYLPLCFGGCRFLCIQRDGSAEGLDCRRAFLDATLESAVRQDARYRHGVK